MTAAPHSEPEKNGGAFKEKGGNRYILYIAWLSVVINRKVHSAEIK